MKSLFSIIKAAVVSAFSAITDALTPHPGPLPIEGRGGLRPALVLRAGAAACALLTLVAVLALSPSAGADGIQDTRYFTSGSRLFGATNAYCIVPAVGGKAAIVRALEVLNDLAPGRVVVFTNGPRANIPYDVGSSNIQVAAGATGGTNGLAAGDNILIHAGNTPDDWYARVRVVTVATTNVLYTPTLSVTIPAGSSFYRVSTNLIYTGITNGATSVRNSFLAVGQRGQPMLIDTTIGAAGSLNAAGEFSGEQ